jgi:multidrug efflux system membrane fusion protein
VTVAPATTADVPVYLDEIGTVASPDNVSIRSQVGGKLLSAHFTEGAEVKQGDLLFKIDPRPFQATVAQAEADLAQSRVNLQLAKSEYERAAGVTDVRALSQEQIDQRKNAVAVAEAQIKAREAAVETAKLNLEYSDIKSPVDGRTGKRLVDPGNVVNANDETLVVVQSLDPVFVDFTTSESSLPLVRKHMAEGTLKVQVTLPNTGATTQPAEPRTGELQFLDNRVENGSGTVQLRATLPNDDRYFWPGQFVNVRLILRVIPGAVLIPTQAQQVGQQGPFVFVVNANKQAELRPVKIGQRQGTNTVIDTGVSANEQVVVTGQMMLFPGAPVSIIDPNQMAPQGMPPAGGPPAEPAPAAAGGQAGGATEQTPTPAPGGNTAGTGVPGTAPGTGDAPNSGSQQ